MRRPASCALALLLLAPATLAAQVERQPGFMVHQMMVCPDSNMAEIDRLSDQWSPILEELRREGMIRSWYDLRHAWGDEWNVVFVTVADSHRAWLDFWSEYVRRVGQRHPGAIAEFQALCTMHRDNMYTVRDGRPGTG